MSRCTPLSPEQVIDLRWRVLRPGRPRESAIFPGDASATHWGLWREDRILTVLSLFPAPLEHQGEHYPQQLRGMATDPAAQGQGLGSELLQEVQAGRRLWCNARLSARPFYARAGWQPIGERFEIPAVGPHQRMVWAPSAT